MRQNTTSSDITLLRALDRHAAAHPERVAFIVLKDGMETRLTYDALRAQAETVADKLASSMATAWSSSASSIRPCSIRAFSAAWWPVA